MKQWNTAKPINAVIFWKTLGFFFAFYSINYSNIWSEILLAKNVNSELALFCCQCLATLFPAHAGFLKEHWELVKWMTLNFGENNKSEVTRGHIVFQGHRKKGKLSFSFFKFFFLIFREKKDKKKMMKKMALEFWWKSDKNCENLNNDEKRIFQT